MTFQIAALLVIIVAAFALFIAGRLRPDVIGLLVLSSLALTGLVSPQEALSGFSSPAVVTVWAMFILSAGLTRTGIAHRLGQPLHHLTRRSEFTLIAALMAVASLLSALINTVTVAAILLPATMELARRSGRSPSRLLMPLALGCLLGGPFTGISTPPNILVTDALRSAGLRPFGIFEFTPITAAVVAAGIAFVALLGRHLLPSQKAGKASEDRLSVEPSYQFDSHIFTLRIPGSSPLAGRTLAQSRIGSALYLTVLALQRRGVLFLAPRPTEVLQAGDILIVHGNPSHLERFHGSNHFRIESSDSACSFVHDNLVVAEGYVAQGSPLQGVPLRESGLRKEHRAHVLALHDRSGAEIKDLPRHEISAGDRLLLQGERDALERVAQRGFFSDVRYLETPEMKGKTCGSAHVLAMRVPEGSVLADKNLVESRLGNAFGLAVAGILRGDESIIMPSPDEKIMTGDLLVLQGESHDLEVLESLQELEIEEPGPSLIADLESQQIGVTEVLLSPRTTLAGKTLAELLFRDHYGISVLAVWRKGRAYRTGLQDMPLQFGDALLVYGKRRNLEVLARDSDFIVLDKAAARSPRMEKAFIAAGIMAGVLLSAILGFVPIAIAGLTGAAMMVMVGCLSMEEAYQAIDWKVVFLIAGMLPLGAAIENTGAAQLGATALIAAVGDLGPRWVVAALFVFTVIGTQIIPTAALVVLMSPVAISAADVLGISPHLLMMTVAISASSSYASPLSHPAHLLVMGPGGYSFMDYLKIGVPLTIIVIALAIWLLPVMWPP